MGPTGVVVLSRDPVDARAEIKFDPAYEVAGVALQVVDLPAVLGRDDDPKMVAVVFAPLDEGGAVRPVELAVEHLHGIALASGTVALDIEGMTHERAAAAAGVDDGLQFDDDPLLAGWAFVSQLYVRRAARTVIPGSALTARRALRAGRRRRTKE